MAKKHFTRRGKDISQNTVEIDYNSESDELTNSRNPDESEITNKRKKGRPLTD